jgi:hypothetical protein
MSDSLKLFTSYLDISKILRWILFILITISFIVLIILTPINLSLANDFYSHYSTSTLYILSVPYLVLSILGTYISLFLIILNLKSINIYIFILTLIFLGINIGMNLLIFYFIPSIYAGDNNRVMYLAIFNLICAVLFLPFIYYNSKYDIISYLSVIVLIVISGFNINFGNSFR